MKRLISKYVSLLLFSIATQTISFAQNSVLINLGSASCPSPIPGFFLIKNPLNASPSLMAGCDLAAQLPDYYSVFIAYNPRNNKVYVADIRTGVTKIWILDIGLPASIGCPSVIPVEPDYTYSYVSNNFEFDNNGDLWSFSNYDVTTGRCSIDKFDVTSGNVINTRTLQFPAGNFPTTITSGDLTITPNGRMFATLGISPSRLYEIKDYSSTTGNASATYLQTLPQECFGIAYLNGQLEITGFQSPGTIPTSCYYFDYNISTNTLGALKNFQNGQSPIDNTSFTPALGTTKQIINSSLVNATTADIIYEVFVKNMGNTILNNINISDDLGIAFGAANVSNVSVAFTNGANAAGLQLNPLYNGKTVTNILLANQQLPNQNATNNDYFFKVQVSCRVSNINKNTIYYNSAIGSATINNAIDPINVTDSSNNGTAAVVDPNNDGNASEDNENIPTPFNITSLPVRFINANVTLVNNTVTTVTWAVATPVTNALKFEPQFSTDGINWTSLADIKIENTHQSNYSYYHTNIPAGNIYYRIKQVDKDGQFVYSRVMLLQRKSTEIKYRIYPNPAGDFISVSAPYNATGKTYINLYDAVGRSIKSIDFNAGSIQLNTSKLPVGTYLLKMTNNNQTTTEKILIRH
ncbi:hypothetical protein BH10BAC3_BH10BAC3_11560 [soil metagenome]